ncbi:phosphocholine cytidylyltransferase family protein [Alphaproteobacteria bacterium]|nr:phosphocholine cytidylyltransferase family protein [Alphaproteobacteria bacterium]
MSRCLILAAGEGKRLRPLTEKYPKALVTLLDRPLLHWQLDVLKAAGIKNVGLVTGYKAEQLSGLGYPTFLNSRFGSTNMVESLFSAITFFENKTEDIIISYGDIIYQRDNLSSVLNTKGDLVVMVDLGWFDLWSLRNQNPLDDAETLKINRAGKIVEIGKKPHSLDDIQGQYTGLIKVSCKKIREFIAFYKSLDRNAEYDNRTFQKMHLTTFLQLLINAGWSIIPAPVTHGWLEVDTTEDLNLYEKLHTTGQLSSLWNADE